MALQDSLGSLSGEDLTRTLLLLAAMSSQGDSPKSPLDQYVEEERKRREEEEQRNQMRGFNRLPGTLASALPPSGARNTLQALGTANALSEIFGGPTIGSALGK